MLLNGVYAEASDVRQYPPGSLNRNGHSHGPSCWRSGPTGDGGSSPAGCHGDGRDGICTPGPGNRSCCCRGCGHGCHGNNFCSRWHPFSENRQFKIISTGPEVFGSLWGKESWQTYHIFIYITTILVFLEGVAMERAVTIVLSMALHFLGLQINWDTPMWKSHREAVWQEMLHTPFLDPNPPHTHPPKCVSYPGGRYGQRCSPGSPHHPSQTLQ